MEKKSVLSESVNDIVTEVTPKTSGLDEGMTLEDERHKTLVLLGYIATLLEKIERNTRN